jgi:ribonuclease HI
MGRPKDRGGLGFRDLEWFNLALHAKQGWRLIQNPDSLAAKILKEKYYPHGEFLDASLGRQPSYVWKSFWNARSLLMEGLVWRVGNGRRIRIWSDKWVPKASGGYIQSPVRVLDRNAVVSELLDRDANWWNTALIYEIFQAEEAELICDLVVSPRSREDRLIWNYNKSGDFTVRSAYHLAKDKYEADKGSCSNRDSYRPMWKALWAIEGPKAAKSFLWKACSEILPTKDKLFKKNITQDPLCPICCREIETTCHILWSCPSAQDVWGECSLRIQKCHSYAPNFMSVMGILIERCSAEEIQLAVLVARQIWNRRNSMVFSRKFTSPKVLVRTATDQLGAFMSANQHVRAQSSGNRREPQPQWTKPPQGFAKVNWDAAVDSNRKRIGLGVIVRNHEGDALAMISETMGSSTDPVTAEALAARRAVEVSHMLGLRKIILEGDALQIVQALQSTDGGKYSYGLLIEDMQQLLRRFSEFSVQFVRREANGAAHKLARLALSMGENKFWRDNFPFQVHTDVSNS